MASIARKNLLEDLPRFLVAQAGIMFAVSLVTIQTGILNGFLKSTTLLIDSSKADIWLTSEKLVNFELTEPLFYGQLNTVREVEGVEKVEFLIRGGAIWNPPEGEISPLTIIGFNPNGELFQPGKLIKGNLQALKEPYAIVADKSRLSSLGIEEVGDRAKVDDLPAILVGIASGTQSIISSTFLFTSLETANTYINADITSTVECNAISAGNLRCIKIVEKKDKTKEPEEVQEAQKLSVTDPITHILIKAKPGEDLQALKQRLTEAVPETAAYTRAEMRQKQRNYWQSRTSLGFVLGIGAIVGIVVGVVVVAQILYSSVSDHIKEFGTLKAMGASDKELYGVIVEQALWMAILGYIPGMLVCWGLSLWVANATGIIILITPISAMGVLGITVVMCVGSAFFAIQKVTKIDPAIVFKA
ncbi:MAG: FtsX-like permease family protein [Okeania sp. SIO2H7]|nr:FtsX-like permease family protein [Okeania sp. SIO2H7]